MVTFLLRFGLTLLVIDSLALLFILCLSHSPGHVNTLHLWHIITGLLSHSTALLLGLVFGLTFLKSKDTMIYTD